jgi:hypothetical protein
MPYLSVIFRLSIILGRNLRVSGKYAQLPLYTLLLFVLLAASLAFICTISFSSLISKHVIYISSAFEGIFLSLTG